MPIARLALAVAMLLAAAVCQGQAQEGSWLGAKVEAVTPAMMAEEGLAVPFGARVTAVEPASPADAAGLAQGDIIISVNGKGIDSDAEFAAEIAKLKPGESAELMRFRGKSAPTSVKVTLAAGEAGGEQAPVVITGTPQLLLNSGGHMSVINDVVFTADGKHLVSASDDKTIRVWDLATGKTERMILGEAETGSPGKVFAMALSPDGRWLAAGGKFHNSDVTAGSRVRLYDFASGELVALLEGHTDVVLDLAFSPDSKYLISGSGDNNAIIWDVAAKSLKHKLTGHEGSIYAVTFTNDSERAVTGSFDRTLRLWSVADGSEVALRTGHEHKIRSIAVRPDGAIATGDEGGKIWLWDGKTGDFLEILGQQETAVGDLTFSSDGKYLLAGVGYQGRGSDCYVYDAKTGEVLVVYKEHNNIVLATAISPDNLLAATGGGDQQEIRIWDIKTGKPRLREDGQPMVLKGGGQPAWAAAFSDDGHRIAWGSTWKSHTTLAQNPLEHVLTLPSGEQGLGRPEPLTEEQASHFRRAEIKHGNLSLSHRAGGEHGFDAFLDVADGGDLHASIERGATDGYQHRAYTFSPDGKTIVSAGDNGYLTSYDVDGQENGHYVGHTGDVWAVTPSPDGRYVVSGSADQTVRLWNLKTRELIVTLFYDANGEWVMWTPQGYYTGSPGGGELVGWQLNQGASKEARYVRGRQLRDKLLRPDIVERAITLASAEAALEEAGLAKVSVETLLTHTLPVLKVEAAPEAAGGRTIILVSSEKNPLPILQTRITVSDGKQEKAVEPKVIALPPGTPQPEKGATLRAYQVPLFKGANTVRVVAVNAAGESEPTSVLINHNGEGALDRRGTLWVLAIGSDSYPGGKSIADPATGQAFRYPDLKYAGADAKAFAEATASHMQGRHTKTDVTILVNGGTSGEPTRANILAAFKRIQAESADTDTIVILLAGHGENWAGGRYHFLPTDFKRATMAEVGDNVIDWKDDIQPVIAGARGHKILFLDACYSANAYNKTLLADADADGFVAFSAAAPGQKAWEFAKEGHGAFTFMLIEALKGADAALDPLENGVTVYKLGDYVNLKVRERTFGKQTPEFRSGQGNFVLTRM